MHHQLYGEILIVIVASIFVITTDNSTRRCLQPTGPVMCGGLCNQIVGCFVYIFRPVDLSCCMSNGSEIRQQQMHITVKDKDRLHADKHLRCHVNTRIFHTRRNSLKCQIYARKTKMKKEIRDRQSKLTGNGKTKKHFEPASGIGINITLHKACEEGRLDLVKHILLHRNEDINCRGKRGRTPVMVAARRSRVSVFDYLVGESCDMSAVDDDSNTVLHMACKGGNINIVKKLLQMKAIDIDSESKGKWTPMLTAAALGFKNIVDLLIKNGCDPTRKTSKFYNILHIACGVGVLDIVKYVISNNIVNIDSRGYCNRTAVTIAAMGGHVSVFEYLVNKSSNLTLLDKFGNNALNAACIRGHFGIVSFIVSRKLINIESRGVVLRTPVLQSVRNGRKDIVQFLKKHHCDLKAVDEEKDNILHLACRSGNVEMVRYILSLGVVSIESRGFQGRTPLLTAVEVSARAVVEVLLNKGCNVSAADDLGNTVLHVACTKGLVDMVKYLITVRGVKGMEKMEDSRGRTPTQAAQRKSKTEVVSFLREHFKRSM